MSLARTIAAKRLARVDVQLDGGRPWDPQIHDRRLFGRVLRHGSLGLGEAYVEGWWDCERLDELFHRLLRGGVDRSFASLADARDWLRAALFDLQSLRRAGRSVRRHYDLGNDLFEAMLDPRMVYSCGYWPEAATLAEAQEAKLRLVCEKLHLKPGQRVLDVGCGWGGAARFAASRYQVEVVGITLSPEQVEVARDVCLGLPVEIRLQDYRQLQGRFDRVFSLGMFEHVGARSYRAYLTQMRRLLHDDGLMLLHTIGGARSSRAGDPWLTRYVFPNSMLPSAAQVSTAIEGLFVLEDWHNFGADYDTTLMHWSENFERAWPSLAERYGERFHRVWRYYLLFCAGTFRARRNQLWQLVLSPHGVAGGYRSIR